MNARMLWKTLAIVWVFIIAGAAACAVYLGHSPSVPSPLPTKQTSNHAVTIQSNIRQIDALERTIVLLTPDWVAPNPVVRYNENTTVSILGMPARPEDLLSYMTGQFTYADGVLLDATITYIPSVPWSWENKREYDKWYSRRWR